MGGCCRPGDYDKLFDEKNARAKAREYARKGLTDDARRIVDFVRARMSPGYSVLEVGGGVGAIQLELLRDGAARALNVELATQYEHVASELIRERGLGDQMERRLGDFVREADAIPAADVVVLQRVVCCYPDADALVGAAADHARRLLLLTFPVERWWIRVGLAAGNAWFRLRGSTFRSFVHSTAAVLATAERHGMRLAEHRHGLIWQVLAFERTG
ncbi:MAG TPA: SAM-dependent methyltransferase [Candidatus Limnocylindria bacterium]